MAPSWVDLKIITFKLARRLFSKRARLASLYLRGSGIEIGALAHPLAVPPGVTVKYLDKVDRAEVIRMLPELEASKVVAPDIIDDGFILAHIPDSSQDFIIANHVLEHTPDPVQALNQWSRVLRPGGILYLCVPIANRSFDAGRSLTTVEHFLEDYRLYQQHAWAELDRRNREHLAEWINISEPNILSKRDPRYTLSAPEAVEKRVKEANISATNELHFHTFSFITCRDLLRTFTTSINPACEIKTLENNFTELIAILGKKADDPLMGLLRSK
jgi:SAM-dependent methyltransferase